MPSNSGMGESLCFTHACPRHKVQTQFGGVRNRYCSKFNDIWPRSRTARCKLAPSVMTSLPGGASDKAGNAYEELWTSLRVKDLLSGEASRIRLEPPGDDGLGIEFEIDILGQTWGEQTKDSDTTWTIKRLRSDGVLAAAKHQIERGRGFRLVTSSAATDLQAVSHRARSSKTHDEFRQLLTQKLQPAFDDLRSSWAVTEDVAWEMLKSIHVEHHPTASLRKLVRQAFQFSYAGDLDLVAASVRDFCSRNLHQDITAPQVAAYLKERGFRERLLAGDEDTRRKLLGTLERQQRRVKRTAPAFGLVPRPEMQQIVNDLLDPGRPQIVIVDAPAGYGKSAVVADVATALDRRGWFVAVARMDGSAATPTSDHLGREMGLSDSPSVLLAGVTEGAPGLLVVDQLDAVSEFSGRMPDSYDAVEDVLDEAARTQNLKVLLVVRTVDLENDQRLRPLLRREDKATRHTLSRFEADQVRRYLVDHNVPVPSDETLTLLRTPLHLSVYGRLSEDARALSYRTLKDLYDQFTPEVRRRATARAGQLEWLTIISFLIRRMSKNETLAVSRGALASFQPAELAALESENVLLGDESRVGFFHESYFDYLFAQAFIEGGEDLHTFLASSGQFLFRRAQARQVLEYLTAAEDRRPFRDVVVQLLTSPDIRTHLKHVVVTVLRQVNADPEDWAALEALAWSEDAIGPHVLALLSDARWFDAADGLGRWETWLADPERAGRATNQLIAAARQRGNRAAELVEPYIGRSEEWRLRLRTLIEWSVNPELVPLTIGLITNGHLDDARGPIATNSDFWSIVHGLLADDPEGAARVTGAFLRRALKRARDYGSDDPFDSQHLDTHSPSGNVIGAVAEKAPTVFLDEVLPFVTAVAQANQHDRDGRLPAGSRWRYRWHGSDHSVDHILFAATEAALVRAATADPGFAQETISKLRVVESEELRFLACRALTALDDHDGAIDWVIDDPRNLVLGWVDSQHWASRELIAAHSPECSGERFGRLETAVLTYRSQYERRPVGYGQYVLLDGLDRSRLSEHGRHRLAELVRRFDAPPPKPRRVVASFVGSPISHEASTKMSDENWLSALRKHATKRNAWNGEKPIGGASELAQVLEHRAKEDPERFALLALRFDKSIPATAGAHALRGVHAALDRELLTALCEHLAGLYGEDLGRDVCTAVAAASSINHRLVVLIDRYSTATDPDREWARTKAAAGAQEQYYYGGDFLSAGLNCTRGGAALAAASVLYKGDDHLAALFPVVERLATDRTMAVRACAAEALLPLLNHASGQALDLAATLLDSPVDVLDARTTESLLTHCVLRRPEQFASYLQKAIQGPDTVAERGGHIWAVADYRGSIVPPVPEVVSALPPRARKGAAAVLAQNVADSADALAVLFDDPDAEVRAAAASGMRHIAEVAPDAVNSLIEAFIRSAAFAQNMDGLIDALEASGTRLPASALEVCERAVDTSGRELGDIRTARHLAGRDLITVVLRLYRQGSPEARRRCLDIIDRLTELNVYGVNDALAKER